MGILGKICGNFFRLKWQHCSGLILKVLNRVDSGSGLIRSGLGWVVAEYCDVLIGLGSVGLQFFI